ncbi:MAG: hypothetical protein JWN04_4957 [Myxococcaceae bacterium]|nr:hypothetical protein [Myxococcaceae bacterium]
MERETDVGGTFTGDAILMMLYANGRGVSRNLELAIKLACNGDGAEDEINERVQALETLASGPRKEPFDFCDDAESGLTMGWHSIYGTRLACLSQSLGCSRRVVVSRSKV